MTILEALTDWRGLLGIAIGCVALLFLIRPGRRTGGVPARCKQWVPLSYVNLWPDNGTDPPHIQCRLAAGHQPRDRHLIDPDEVCELRMYAAPF